MMYMNIGLTKEQFDWKSYIELYPDLLMADINNKEGAWSHYQMYGKNEGRVDKSELLKRKVQFDWKYYIDTYPDLKINGINTSEQAWIHYLCYGHKENRNICEPNKRKPIITILGSCRQKIIENVFEVTNIQEQISYPHSSCEIMEVIKFCLTGHISPENTKFVFRTPILTKIPLYWNEKYLQELNKTDVFLIEIASKKYYRYNDWNVHHIVEDEIYNVPIRKEIFYGKTSKIDVENDLLKMRVLLKRPIIIVTHLITKNEGERYELGEWLERFVANIIYHISIHMRD